MQGVYDSWQNIFRATHLNRCKLLKGNSTVFSSLSRLFTLLLEKFRCSVGRLHFLPTLWSEKISFFKDSRQRSLQLNPRREDTFRSQSKCSACCDESCSVTPFIGNQAYLWKTREGSKYVAMRCCHSGTLALVLWVILWILFTLWTRDVPFSMHYSWLYRATQPASSRREILKREWYWSH